MKIVVLGAGAWGTALAVSAAAHAGCNEVTLWARDEQQAAGHAGRAAESALPARPGIPARPARGVGRLPARWPPDADLVVVGTPMAALRGMLKRLNGLPAPHRVAVQGLRGRHRADGP